MPHRLNCAVLLRGTGRRQDQYRDQIALTRTRESPPGQLMSVWCLLVSVRLEAKMCSKRSRHTISKPSSAILYVLQPKYQFAGLTLRRHTLFSGSKNDPHWYSDSWLASYPLWGGFEQEIDFTSIVRKYVPMKDSITDLERMLIDSGGINSIVVLDKKSYHNHRT